MSRRTRLTGTALLRGSILVRVLVIHIGGVLVVVLDPIVMVRVCVLACDRRVVDVVVVAVIVAVRVLVVDRCVHVAVCMSFGRVQVDAHAEGESTESGAHACSVIAQ